MLHQKQSRADSLYYSKKVIFLYILVVGSILFTFVALFFVTMRQVSAGIVFTKFQFFVID